MRPPNTTIKILKKGELGNHPKERDIEYFIQRKHETYCSRDFLDYLVPVGFTAERNEFRLTTERFLDAPEGCGAF
jgi:hypothetical protein